MRLARNTQLLLRDEAHLHQVVDPAGGSAFVETLTQQLAERAWQHFQEIERRGGVSRALADGSLARDIADDAQRRAHQIATRSRVIVGVSDFVDLTEPRPESETSDALAAHFADEAASGTFPLRRLAAPFEGLRDAAAARAAHSRQPTVFLATLGARREWASRVQFTRGLLAAGGIDAIGERDGCDPAGVARDFAASGLELAVLCASEARYDSDGLAALDALRRAGARRVYWAGPPGERREALLAAGLGEYLFVGCDALSLLRDVHWHLGLASLDTRAATHAEARA
jgi:methylmalonyl-CoA mutase